MNCSGWSDCMSPEQYSLLIGAIVTLVLAVVGSVIAIWQWLPKYIARLADERFKDREHKRTIEERLADTEIQNKRIEAEVDAQQAIALPEAFVKTTTMLGQVLERHAVVDERNADIAENRNAIDKQRIESDRQQMETLNRLANSIGDLNRSIHTSQTWNENRTNDIIDTNNEANVRMGNMERSLDRLLQDVTETREKLIAIHAITAQESTLLLMKTQLEAFKLILESQAPKPLAPMALVEREQAPSLDDTIPLSPDDMLEATRVFPDAESEDSDNKPNEENKKDEAA